jgi:hypothetical protein
MEATLLTCGGLFSILAAIGFLARKSNRAIGYDLEISAFFGCLVAIFIVWITHA